MKQNLLQITCDFIILNVHFKKMIYDYQLEDEFACKTSARQIAVEVGNQNIESMEQLAFNSRRSSLKIPTKHI